MAKMEPAETPIFTITWVVSRLIIHRRSNSLRQKCYLQKEEEDQILLNLLKESHHTTKKMVLVETTIFEKIREALCQELPAIEASELF